MDKYNKSFIQQYKESKIVSLISIIGGLAMIISASFSEWITVSPFFLIMGSFFLFFGIIYFLLYWKCANYQKNNQLIPKSFRIICAIFSIFYLVFYQLENNKYHLFLLLKEIRFYTIWIIINTLVFTLIFSLIDKNFSWIAISLYILNLTSLSINLILSIFIWKHQGINKKLLKVLTILTLNYRNYRFYKKIIEVINNE